MSGLKTTKASGEADFCDDAMVLLTEHESHIVRETFEMHSDSFRREVQPLGDETPMPIFVGEVVEMLVNGVRDQAAGGFWLYGQRVGDKRRSLQGMPLPAMAEGFHRWRLPGVDGVARLHDRNAPSIVLSESTGALLFVRRDNLKPKRLNGVAELVRKLEEVRL